MNSKHGLELSYETAYGRFEITPDKLSSQLFSLQFENKEKDRINLAVYCSITDAVSAVSQQETGYPDWDNLDKTDIPYRIHDITCWKFHEKTGTLGEIACS